MADSSEAKRHKSAPGPEPVRIGTRESQLALWQANMVHAVLGATHPDQPFQVVGMTTLGDKDMKPLSSFAAKGVFTKELDTALLESQVDLVVHCMKDLPTRLPDGIQMAAVLERGETADAVVLHAKHKGKTLAELAEGSVVGTSALRRKATLARELPGLVFKDIRGNVNTRLAKLDSGDYDAIILAKIGLERLGFQDRIAEVLDKDRFGFAVGQGALAIVCREGDDGVLALVRPLEHPPTRVACWAERGLLRTLEGGCKVPIAVHTACEASDGGVLLTIKARVLSVDGSQLVEEASTALLDAQGDDAVAQQALEAGNALAARMLEQGAGAILDVIRQASTTD